MKYVDVHSHWVDEKLSQSPADLTNRLQDCLDRRIDFFLQGGVNQADWKRQIDLKKLFPENFGLCFGLHPYFVSAQNQNECEAALDELIQLLPQAMALGETGLDFRPHIMKDSRELQIEMFENQIELAKAFSKPMVLHVVQAHEKALQILDLWRAPQKGGLVHAFNGSLETAKMYFEKGFLISVGAAVTFDKNRKLRDCIKKMPLEYLLLESDSPDQPPNGWEGLNSSASILKIAEAVALIRNISAFDVLEINTGNFKRLFSLI
jgi:TatD DNase family protein